MRRAGLWGRLSLPPSPATGLAGFQLGDHRAQVLQDTVACRELTVDGLAVVVPQLDADPATVEQFLREEVGI